MVEELLLVGADPPYDPQYFTHLLFIWLKRKHV